MYEMTIHYMKLNPTPFDLIKNNIKTIELRLYDEKRKNIRIGDMICFTQIETGETLYRKVEQLHIFESFTQLYKKLDLLKCGYTLTNIDNASHRDMELYYTKEEQLLWGVVGIELINV